MKHNFALYSIPKIISKLSKLTFEESSKNAFQIQNLSLGFASAKLQLIFGLAKVFNFIFLLKM